MMTENKNLNGFEAEDGDHDDDNASIETDILANPILSARPPYLATTESAPQIAGKEKG